MYPLNCVHVLVFLSVDFQLFKFSSLGAHEWWLMGDGKPNVHNIESSIVFVLLLFYVVICDSLDS